VTIYSARYKSGLVRRGGYTRTKTISVINHSNCTQTLEEEFSMITDEKAKEVKEWKEFVQKSGITSIDIPYALTYAAINIVGVFHLRDPLIESSTEGAVAGVVNGSYSLNKNNGEAKLYDPTGQLLRAVFELNLTGKGEFRARLDTRKWDGSWNEGSWVIIWRG